MNGKTILCADDEAHILHVVSLKLQNAGFNVIMARDGEEAFEAAMGATIDMVITDYQMPNASGLDLAKRLHKEPGKRDLPVLLLTAHGLGLERVDLVRAGISACLSKPFSPRELLEKVHELLAQSAPRPNTAGSTPSEATASPA